MPIRGHCLCGAVQYEIDGGLGPLVNCHCRFCRRAHGAAFSTITPVARADFRLTSGEDVMTRYDGRHFCGRCATRIYNAAASIPDRVMIVVASLEEEPEHGPIMHINLESKAKWYEILDDLPTFDGFPPGSGQSG